MLLPSTKKPDVQLDTQLEFCRTREPAQDWQLASLRQVAHWLWQAAHTVLEVGEQGVATNWLALQLEQAWQVGLEVAEQEPERNCPLGQACVQVEQARLEESVQGLVSNSLAAQTRQGWQVGLLVLVQVPARKLLRAQAPGKVQGEQVRSEVAVHVPVRN